MAHKIDRLAYIAGRLVPAPRKFSLCVVVLAFVGAWFVFSAVVAPRLIASAYRGQSFAVFNRTIRNQAIYPLRAYQQQWNAIARNITALLTVGGVTAFVIIGPVLLAPPWRRERDDARALSAGEPARLGPRRLRVVQVTIALLIGGSLVDIVFDVEHWPFSPYPMYATPAPTDSVTVTRLFGVREDIDTEIPLTSDVQIAPFDRSRLAAALRRLRARGDDDRLRAALLDCLVRYERRRQQGQHHGPPLRGVRLYEVSWNLDPRAANIAKPTRKHLGVSVYRSSAGSLRQQHGA